MSTNCKRLNEHEAFRSREEREQWMYALNVNMVMKYAEIWRCNPTCPKPFARDESLALRSAGRGGSEAQGAESSRV